MSEQSGLERRYRRLLTAYPKLYRQRHEEEMLTVLLSDAQPGQRRPRLAETEDLLVGAARTRLRLIQPYPGNAGRDALAMFTVFAPLLLVGPAIVTLMLHLVVTPPTGIPASVGGALRAALQMQWAQVDAQYQVIRNGIDLASAGQVVIAVAVLLRLRRVALMLIAITLGWWLLLGSYRLLLAPSEVFFLVCYLLEATALLASAGPRRGLQLLTWKSVVVLAAAAAALTVSWTFWMRLMFRDFAISGAWAQELVEVTIGLAMIGLVVALASRPGRYLASLYATAAYPIAFYLYRVAAHEYRGRVTASVEEVLPPLIAACAIVLVACRRADPFGPDQRSGKSAPA